jgi:hypothetical protein
MKAQIVYDMVRLPVKRELTLAYYLSFTVALIMATVSLIGLLVPSAIYPGEALQRSFIANDVVNLLIGLPILLGSMWLTRRGRLIGLLFWPGALLYVTYNYLTYSIALPFTWQFLAYLALVIASLITLASIFSGMDLIAIQQRLSAAMPVRLPGGVLIGLGLLFFLRSIGLAVGALSGQSPLAGAELAVLIADLLTMPAWIVGGMLLWQRKPLGYASVAGLLFQGSMLFVGLLAYFVVQPFLASTPFALVDFLVILFMGLVCFIPFGLVVRSLGAK